MRLPLQNHVAAYPLILFLTGCIGCRVTPPAVDEATGERRPKPENIEQYTPPGIPLPDWLREDYVSSGRAWPVSRQMLWWQATAPDWLPYWKQAAQEHPTSVVAWSGLAVTSFRGGEQQVTLRAAAEIIRLDDSLGFGYAQRALALGETGQTDAAAAALAEGLRKASYSADRWYLARLLLQSCEEQGLSYDSALEVADGLVAQDNPSHAVGEVLRGSVLLLKGEFRAAEEAVGPAVTHSAYYYHLFSGPNAETVLALARLWSGRDDPFEPFRDGAQTTFMWPAAWLVLAVVHGDEGDWQSALMAAEAYYIAAGPDGLIMHHNAPILPVEQRLWRELLGKVAGGADESQLLIAALAHGALGDTTAASRAFSRAAGLPESTPLSQAGAAGLRRRELVAVNERSVGDFMQGELSP